MELVIFPWFLVRASQNSEGSFAHVAGKFGEELGVDNGLSDLILISWEENNDGNF